MEHLFVLLVNILQFSGSHTFVCRYVMHIFFSAQIVCCLNHINITKAWIYQHSLLIQIMLVTQLISYGIFHGIIAINTVQKIREFNPGFGKFCFFISTLILILYTGLGFILYINPSIPASFWLDEICYILRFRIISLCVHILILVDISCSYAAHTLYNSRGKRITPLNAETQEIMRQYRDIAVVVITSELTETLISVSENDHILLHLAITIAYTVVIICFLALLNDSPKEPECSLKEKHNNVVEFNSIELQQYDESSNRQMENSNACSISDLQFDVENSV